MSNHHWLLTAFLIASATPLVGVAAEDTTIGKPQPPALTLHPVVSTTEGFFSAVSAGEWDRAAKLCLVERFTKEKLQKLRDTLQLHGVKLQEARVGREQAMVITEEILFRDPQQGRSGRWGISLRKTDGVWLIRDFDFLPDDRAELKYLEGFFKVEPAAKSTPIKP